MATENQLATVDDQPKGALADMRSQAMNVPVEVMREGLAIYSEKRAAFRDWLRSQLVAGIHYGTPPGCEPNIRESDGWVGVWMKGGIKYFPPEQWTPKPSFYKAGADFVVDLMGLRTEYEADVGGWEQLGKPNDTFVYACYLIDQSGKRIGEGRGARKVGTKNGDVNNTIKMAMKSAKVSAVLETYGLADLFTQDLEDGVGAPVHDNPPARPDAPVAAPRGKRLSPDETVTAVTELGKSWKETRQMLSQPDDMDTWRKFVLDTTGREGDPLKPSWWSSGDLDVVRLAVEKEAERA